MSLLKSKYFVVFGLLGLIFATSNFPLNAFQENKNAISHEEQTKHVVIVGGGFIGALQAYFAHLDAAKKGVNLRVTIYEKYNVLCNTTCMNTAPSLTPDEILSVVPRGKDLMESSQILFSKPGGIRVDDVEGIHDSKATSRFMTEANLYSQDDAGHQQRTQALLELGKMSMNLWQTMYDTADQQLRDILVASNFNPCRDQKDDSTQGLHDGYRIDLIYSVANALNKALAMKKDYEGLGYKKCEILSPEKVESLDPFLASFCKNHSDVNEQGTRQWHNDTVALWRPGGCIDAKVFLPGLYAYLKKNMGTYVDQAGQQRDYLQLCLGNMVESLKFDTVDSTAVKITGLTLTNGEVFSDPQATYILCPGEAVGTLDRFGLQEPAYARFAGASLALEIPLSEDKIQEYAAFNHCMEVHQVGVVLAWQARYKEDKISIVVAGTKAFYADQAPSADHDFAKNRNLLQLNMINDVLPQFVSIALGRDTKGQKLTQQDLDFLEKSFIAKRWVGTRAVAFDGFPTFGNVYTADGAKVDNGIVVTHLGSGGSSFGPAAALIGTHFLSKESVVDPLITKVLNFAQSNRSAQA